MNRDLLSDSGNYLHEIAKLPQKAAKTGTIQQESIPRSLITIPSTLAETIIALVSS